MMDILLIENQPHIIRTLPQFNPKYIINSLEAWRNVWRIANPTYELLFNEKKDSVELKKGDVIQGFSLEYIVYIGAVIHDFETIHSLDVTLKNFKHFEEFKPTIFELVSANHLFKNPYASLIEFSPEILINNNPQKPDFKYFCKLSQKEVFAECKSLAGLHRAKINNCNKLLRHIMKDLQEINKPENIRIEISFSKLPSHYDKNLGIQLKAGIDKILEKKYFNEEVKLNFTDLNGEYVKIYIQEKIYKIHYSNGWIMVGNNKNQLMCDYFLSEESDLDNAVKRSVREAIEQTPNKYTKHVFLELLPIMDVLNTQKIIAGMGKVAELRNDLKITLCQEKDNKYFFYDLHLNGSFQIFRNPLFSYC